MQCYTCGQKVVGTAITKKISEGVDRIATLEARLAVAVDALEFVSRVTYGTELCNSEEENNQILATHYFASSNRAREALAKIKGH